MRTSHASSNINPRTPNHGTTESHSRTKGKTSRNHQKECRSNYYYPGLAKSIKQWVMQCEDCIKYKRINETYQITTTIIRLKEYHKYIDTEERKLTNDSARSQCSLYSGFSLPRVARKYPHNRRNKV